MASRIRRFFQSPLRVVLIAHFLAALASGVAIATVMSLQTRGGAAAGTILPGTSMTLLNIPGTFWLWAMFLPLAGLLAVCLAVGLVFGRWGLPGHLQGRAVFYVPPLAALYFLGGALVLYLLTGGGLALAAHQTWTMIANTGGLTLLLMYVAFSASAVGLGWAVALAITEHKRRHGKWETIGYVEGQ